MASYEITEWVSPDGSVTNLMDIPNIGIQPGRTGAFMPPVRQNEEIVPYRHGSHIKSVSFGPRDIDLPLRIKDVSENALRHTIRDLLSRFNPIADDGRLRVTRPDGTAREIYCRYNRGLEGLEDANNFGIIWQRAIVTFKATDPLWYDVASNTLTLSSGASASFFPGTPFRLTSSGIFSSPAPIINDGDVEAWPIWTIQGPASNIILRNLDTGEKIQFLSSFSLLAGETLIIDTRERFRKVIKYVISGDPPVISNVAVTNITSSTVDINWDTDQLTDGQVEYGPTTSYGFSISNPALISSHSFHLTGLPEKTQIFFRITSTSTIGSITGVVKEYKSLVPGSTLWPLYKGSNSVNIELTDTTTETLVSLAFNRAFLSV